MMIDSRRGDIGEEGGLGNQPLCRGYINQGTATAAALSGGATVTMIANRDGKPFEYRIPQVPDVDALGASIFHRQRQHLIEVAIVHEALPIDADETSAHDRRKILPTMRATQQGDVVVVSLRFPLVVSLSNHGGSG